MRKLILACCLGLAGCQKYMTNDEVIRETKKCEGAGMKAELVKNTFNWETVAVHCELKEGR